MTAANGIRLGIDVGGTFTDIYYEDPDEASVIVAKVRTSITQEGGLPSALDAAGVDMRRVGSFVYSTTLATNAILERALGRCALVTTLGFRDVIELGRRDRAKTYGLDGRFVPLIPRQLRFEIAERVNADGEVLVTPTVQVVRELGAQLRELQPAAVAIAFLNSYVNDANEQTVADLLAPELGDIPIIRSADVHPEWGEFDRFTLTALHGVLWPIVGDHLAARKSEVEAMGFSGEMFAMQSNGGVSPVDHARRQPANLALSGPAAGVIGASALAGHRADTIVTCDMGGTSFDVGIVEHGRPGMTTRSQIAFRVPLGLSTVDVHELAAGGSSVVKVVGGQLITVGPESVGSKPGPACYGLGGGLATITDAAIVLNRFVEGQSFGSVGEIRPSAELARAAIDRAIAEPLGLSTDEAAEAVIARAATVMAGGVRTMSIGRGLDPRQTKLFIAGGAGPLFACEFAREAGVKEIIIPPHPGVVNAIGCALTDLRQDYSRTVNLTLSENSIDVIREVLSDQRDAGLAFREVSGLQAEPLFVVEFEMQYVGQTHTVTVPIRADRLDHREIVAAFDAEYARWRGVALGDAPINVRTIRTIMLVARGGARNGHSAGSHDQTASGPPVEPTDHQRVFVGGSWVDVGVHHRDDLHPGAGIQGPSLIQQLDCTVWVSPDASGVVDADRSLLLTLTPEVR
jgi:N-methylhydantoinase A